MMTFLPGPGRTVSLFALPISDDKFLLVPPAPQGVRAEPLDPPSFIGLTGGDPHSLYPFLLATPHIRPPCTATFFRVVLSYVFWRSTAPIQRSELPPLKAPGDFPSLFFFFLSPFLPRLAFFSVRLSPLTGVRSGEQRRGIFFLSRPL